MGRKSRGISSKPIIAIYCEGDSEKAYFEMLKRKYNGSNVRAEKISVNSIGLKGSALLNKAVAKVHHLPRGQHPDQVYVVFDRDDLTIGDLEKCSQIAKDNDINIMFSSTNIEVWILMHFQPVMRSYSASELYKILSSENYFNTDYQSFKGRAYDYFLFDRVKMAKQNAEKLEHSQSGNWISLDPFTNIHKFLQDIFNVQQF